MSIQYVTRKGSFDAGHRVMNERMKCFNLHGHTYLYELTFAFEQTKPIGYPVDFKEIKRVGCEWIERYLDHGFIANPHDKDVIKTVQKLGNKLWVMSLNGKDEYCNPSAENIAKEMFLAIGYMAPAWCEGFRLHEVKLWETPNCCTTAVKDSISIEEYRHFFDVNGFALRDYVQEMGQIEYDDRNVNKTA